MKNINSKHWKINPMRIYLLLVIFLGLGSIASATRLNFVGINLGSIDQKFSDVHFKSRGNDFMGSIFWLNAKNIEAGETVTISGGGSKTCYKLVRGIYYNSQRGNRLWPMDNDTLVYFRNTNGTYDNLNITGGLYTSCSGDEYSIYGQITYTMSGGYLTSHIVAGTKYNWNENTISGAFARSFQRFDNKYPIGFIYDDHGGGIGFVASFSDAGGDESDYLAAITKLNQGSGINNLFNYGGTNNSSIVSAQFTGINITTTKGSAINTLMNAGIQGTVGLSFSVNTVEKNTLLGNFDRKTLMFNALNINFSKLINTVRKNAEDMCKGKYDDTSPSDFTTKNLFCIENADVIIDQFDKREALKDKIIVVKNGDVKIGKGMTAGQGPVSIFIDKGNLLLGTGMTKTNFDANGYPTSSAGVTQGISLQGNFIVNGLIMGADSSWNNAKFLNKLFIGGKVASLNTPSYASQGRKDQVKAVLGTGIFESRIWLGNVFTRECDPIQGSGSDGVSCSNSADRNATLPLVIIDRYYPSALIK